MSPRIDDAVLADVGARVSRVRERIADACARAGRSPDEVTLVGASKRQPLERIAAAVLAGVQELGENYVQEARDKQQAVAGLLAAHADAAPAAPRWRLIGHLQRNKAKPAAELFDTVDTVDGERLARALDRRAAEAGRRLELCIQVNLSGESQKSGVHEGELPALLDACASLEHIEVVGLMTMPAAANDPEHCRPAFARLRALRDTLSDAPGGKALRVLSMGMSSDLDVAVEEGATHVRIGTALFGERDRPAAG